MSQIQNHQFIYNHNVSSLSKLDKTIIRHIPPGGNWKNIPKRIPSARLKQIRENYVLGRGSRSTYYGRLRWDMPSYTISTYFNRPGNGCYIHPDHNRLISLREAARLQSFPDSYRFLGSRTSMYKQIGNAVPPLLARAVASLIEPTTFFDLFCGAGGLSLGFQMSGHRCLGGIDIDETAIDTFKQNHLGRNILASKGDLTDNKTKQMIVNHIEDKLGKKRLGLLIGGPPCQGFSTAGNRRTEDDPRNKLPLTFLDMVKRLKPRNFVMEEVTGILSMADGKILNKITETATRLGYACSSFILKAENYGVPQRRRRFFMIGSLRNDKFEEPKPIFGDDAKPAKSIITVHDAISDLSPVNPADENEEIAYKSHKKMTPYQRWSRNLIDFDELVKLQPFC